MESSPSNISKSLFSNEESEESGWTIYFDDFFNSSQKSTASYNNNDAGGNSVISDAASSSSVAYCKTKSKKKLNFKKKTTVRGGVLDDDSLEDTASSPVNSPKIGDMDVLNMNAGKKDEHEGFSQNCADMRKNGLAGFVDGENECTELKKRGLCLVPLSMLVDYLG